MPDSTLITILINSGLAGVFCVLFLAGYIFPKSVLTDLRTERDYERKRADAAEDRADAADQRADAAVAAAQATRDVLGALQAGMALGQRQEVRSIPMGEHHGPHKRGSDPA